MGAQINGTYIPKEIWNEIFSYLDQASLREVELVCRLWKNLVDHYLQFFCTRNWPDEKKDEHISWKHLYQRCVLNSNIEHGCVTIKVLSIGNRVNCLLSGYPLIFGYHDGSVAVQSAVKERQTIQGKQEYPISALFHGQNRLFFASDCAIFMHDMHAQAVQVLETHHQERVVAFSSLAQKLFSASHDKSIGVWDEPTGQWQKRLEGHEAEVTALCVAGKELFSGSRDKRIFSWDIEKGEPIKVLNGHTRGITALCSSQKWLISASDEEKIFVWNAETGSCLKTLKGHQIAIQSLCAHSHFLFSGSKDASIHVWDIRKGIFLQKLTGHEKSILSLDFYQGKLYSSSKDSTVRSWDFRDSTSNKINISSNRRLGEFCYRKDEGEYIYRLKTRFLKKHKKGIKSF